MAEEWLRPSAVAQRLQMPASTLRVYSTKFAPLLSPSASEPPASSDGRRGSRLYSSTDISIISRAKELLAKGMTYEQVLNELRLSIPGARQRTVSMQQPNGASRPDGQIPITAHQIEALVSGIVAASTANLERMVQAWQALAEERAKEILQLRNRVRELEERQEREIAHLQGRVQELEELRRGDPRRAGSLARLFGG